MMSNTKLMYFLYFLVFSKISKFPENWLRYVLVITNKLSGTKIVQEFLKSEHNWIYGEGLNE